MNNDRRKQLERAKALLEEALSIIETCRDEEQEAFDNMPEGLQQSERGEKAEAACSALDECADGTQTAIDSIETAVE